MENYNNAQKVWTVIKPKLCLPLILIFDEQ